MQVANGSTDVSTYFVLRDSTAHAPKTDVTVTDIDLYYVEQGAAISAKADATALAAADSAHGDNQAFHVGQGLYRIDWPDTCFNGGVGKLCELIVVCTGVDTTFLEVELTGVAQTGDSYAIVNHADYGNAKLVRSTTPANTLTVDASHQALALTNAVTNDAITAAAIATGAIDADALAADAFTAAKFAADVTTELQSGLATSAELAKVPKSDGNVTWNATALASINAEVDTALNTAIPGAPTADSINQRIAAFDDLTQAGGGGDLAAILLDTGTTLDTLIKDVPTNAELTTALGTADDAVLAELANATYGLSAIKGYVDDIGVAGAGLTAVPWNAAWDTEVESECDDALVAFGLPTDISIADAVWDEASAHHVAAGSTGKALADVLVDTAEIGTAGAGLTNINLPNQTMDITGSLSGSVGSVTGAVGSVTGAVGSVTGAVGSVTGAVGSIAAGGITAASIATGAIDADSLAADAGAELADAVWDEALAGHAGAGTAGATLSAASAPTVGEVADAVWDEALAGHLGVGSTGAALNAAGAAGDPWTTALPGAYGAGTAGDIIGNLVDDIGALTPAVAISATTAASVSTGALAVRTHHSLSQAISSTYAGNLNAATKLWLAVKAEKDDTDAQAVVFIEKTGGLTVLAGAAYTTVAHGSLTVGGLAGAWTVTVAIDEVATGLLTAYADGMLWAECKALVAGSTVAVWDGVCDVARGIVQTVV